MEHRRRNELQRALADRNFVAGFNCVIVQVAVTRSQTFKAVGIRRDDLGVWRKRGNFFQRAGVIRFDVAGNDDFNLRGLDDGRNSAD